MATVLTGRGRGGTVGKHVRARRGSDVGLPAGATRGAGSRRNCLVGGFPGPKARPSVIFSTQKLSITVGGSAAFYSAVLSCAPEHPVTVSLGNLPACIRVAPTLVVFSPENWMAPQFFRVAVLSAVYDDGNKDDRKLQVLEHESSSEDARFSGNRVIFLPSNVLVQVSGREGCYLLSSGVSIGIATAERRVSTLPWPILHEFAQVDLEPSAPAALVHSTVTAATGTAHFSSSTRELTNRASVVSNQSFAGSTERAGRDSVSSLAPGATTAKRGSSPRRTVLSITASSASLAPSVQSSGDGYYTATPRDGVATVKVVARAQHTAVLFKSGKCELLGRMDVDYPSDEKDRDTTGVNGSRGSNAALSRMLVDIECGDAHVAALTEQGYVMTWGDGSHGRLGHGSLASVRRPQAIKSLFHKRIVHLACGAQHTIAAAEDGDVYSWGYGKCGALGHGRGEKDQVFDSVSMPMEVLSLKSKGVMSVACGDAHSAVVLQSGALLTCGWGEHGRLGRAFENEFSSYFERVTGGAMKKRLCAFVSCGGAHTLALTECKSLLAFGWNTNGQLGLGDRRNRTLPTKIQYFDAGDLVLTSVAAGKLHSMALTQDARVFAWGSDELGQCGVGSFPQLYTVPHLVASTVGLNVTQISAGESHSVALSTASQKQLDAMQSNHPTRYATLEDNFEHFLRSDLEQQARVLAHAKREQLQRELDARRRKPPMDPSSALTRTLQLQRRLESDLAVATIDIDGEGIGARKPTTVIEIFKKTVAFKPDAPALSVKKDGKWKTHSWQQYYNTSARFAKALVHVGVKPHETVNVLGHNSPEWFFVNNGTIMAGAIIAGIYTTNGPEACEYISAHCEAKVVVVENMLQLNKYLKIVRNLPKLKALVMWDGEVPYLDCGVPIYKFSDFVRLGDAVSDATLSQRMDAQLPGHCCTLIYTSGTTGPPKAVMISHDNFTWTAYNVLETLYGVTDAERSVSFLPLSHVAAQLLDIHVPMHLGSQVSFAGPDALKGALVETLREIRPTFFFGVPRVWEKVMEKMREIGASTTGFKKVLAAWAKGKGAKKTERFQFGGDGRKSLSFRLANRVILSKIKDALGLDQCRYCFTGAAPISTECLSFFGSLDIPIYEIFGQSECTGPHSINLPGNDGNPLQTLDNAARAVAHAIGSDAVTVAEARACPNFQQYIADGMKRANAKSTSRAQVVQKFHVLDRDFSIHGGELTPTLKLKRSVVEKMYHDEIESLYE
ncbi:hypothetical protein PybrP1_007933 [[Pythium] brassicae (nom. inval.)]|nr:hypothetical protein PybrP1_007933 [[Pythium] brassicae (nom. inval.)]